MGMRNLGPKVGSQSTFLGVVSCSPGRLPSLSPVVARLASPRAFAPSSAEEPIPVTGSPYSPGTLTHGDLRLLLLLHGALAPDAAHDSCPGLFSF